MHRKSRNIVLVVAALLLGVAVWQFRLAGLAWYWVAMQVNAESRASTGVWLPE